MLAEQYRMAPALKTAPGLPAQFEVPRTRASPLSGFSGSRSMWQVYLGNLEIQGISGQQGFLDQAGTVASWLGLARARYDFFGSEGNAAKDELRQPRSKAWARGATASWAFVSPSRGTRSGSRS